MGLAGVLYEVILQPEPQYCVRVAVSESKDVADPRAADIMQFLLNHEYARILFVKGPASSSTYYQMKTAFRRDPECHVDTTTQMSSFNNEDAM